MNDELRDIKGNCYSPFQSNNWAFAEGIERKHETPPENIDFKHTFMSISNTDILGNCTMISDTHYINFIIIQFIRSNVEIKMFSRFWGVF